jgi:hypothetical protein
VSKSIEGRITFKDNDGASVAVVEFPEIDCRFCIGAAEPTDLKRAIMNMVETAEQVGRTLMETGRFDWEAAGGRR